jgi:cell fate regulator YaaT (PSP1 superfamily)
VPEVVGVRLKPCGKIYNYEVNGVCAKPGMRVVVDSEMGLCLGLVVRARHRIEHSDRHLKKVLRIATVQDREADRKNRSLENDAMSYCIESAKKHNLIMKVVKTEATLDRKRLIFYFTAEGRVDFRELVRDLASKFKTRIEMRQIGVRDEVKFVGGIGCCGKEVCCKVFLTTFEPISIRMAKKQELALNPGKLSGICGRLMCCLGYEIDHPSKGGGEVKEKTKGPVITDKPAPVSNEATPVPVSPKADTIPSPRETDRDTEKVSPQKPLPRKEETKKPHGEQTKPSTQKRKNRGKPFSKRRRFRKKKR